MLDGASACTSNCKKMQPEQTTSYQCHAEGGATKGGVSKCEQTQTKRRLTLTNASKRRGKNASKRKQTQSKRGQPQTNAYTPSIAVSYTALCNFPLNLWARDRTCENRTCEIDQARFRVLFPEHCRICAMSTLVGVVGTA